MHSFLAVTRKQRYDVNTGTEEQRHISVSFTSVHHSNGDSVEEIGRMALDCNANSNSRNTAKYSWFCDHTLLNETQPVVVNSFWTFWTRPGENNSDRLCDFSNRVEGGRSEWILCYIYYLYACSCNSYLGLFYLNLSWTTILDSINRDNVDKFMYFCKP